MISLDDVRAAAQRIDGVAHRTPVLTSRALDEAVGASVDNQKLADAGLVSNAYVSVKLLKRGDVSKKVTVKLQAASASAVESIEAAGGSFETTVRLSRPKTTTKKTADKE